MTIRSVARFWERTTALFPLAVLVVFAVPVAAQPRTIIWKSLDVQARLEATGELHVSERHDMVFSGDWNGGERKFRVEPGQRFELVGISRLDPRTGAATAMRRSTIPSIGLDQFTLSGTTLRWRARRPNDPPFRQQPLAYVIEYRLSNVIQRQGASGYLLRHDFAFADRPGAIERYSLRLDVDPVWRPGPGLEPRIEREHLPPGQSVILRIPLAWMGAGRPPQVREPVVYTPPPPPPPPPVPFWAIPLESPAANLGLLVLFLGLAIALWWSFDRREMAAGRHASEPQIDPRWLAETIFVHRPEVVGAAWDRDTGQAEAAALIAAMAGERKVQNLAGAAPRLKLLVPRETLSEYERAFVDRLFVKGDEIDPGTLRAYYASTGFNPAAAIAAPLDEAARALVGKASAAPLTFGVSGALFVIAATVLALTVASRPWVVPMGAISVGALVLSMLLAASYQSQLLGRAVGALITAPLLVFGAIVAYVVPSPMAVAVVLAIVLAYVALALRAARWSAHPGQLRNMQNFRAARAFFRRRLRQSATNIDELWIPYLLAFGLGKDLDRWSVARPASPRTSSDIRDDVSGPFTPSAGFSGDPAGNSFRPGGGAFGGAGASGYWASSINSFAATVAAPRAESSSSSSDSSSYSSSSDSSSSSSGGSDSGGGSGGGW